CWRTYLDSSGGGDDIRAFLETWKSLLENNLKLKRSDLIQIISNVVKEVGGDSLLIILRCVDAVAGLYQCPASKDSMSILLSAFSQSISIGIINSADEVILIRPRKT
ncbi:MAG: hypothetical protein ACK56I_30135, partial [bacterium]